MLQNNSNFGIVLTGDRLADLREYAKKIAQGYADGRPTEDIRWLSNKENRNRLIAAIRYLNVHLPKLTDLLEEEPLMPKIYVEEGGSPCFRGKAHRYLIEGRYLPFIAKWIESTKWPKWQWKKRAISAAIYSIRQFYDDNDYVASDEEIGNLILEVFGKDAQTNREDPGAVADWVRQLMRRF